MKKPLVVLALIFIIAALIYVYTEWNRTNKDLTTVDAAYKLEDSVLIKEFSTDAARALKKYSGRVIEVNGRIKSIDKEQKPAVLFLGDENSLSTVRASMDTTYEEQYTQLRKGESIRIRGTVTGGEVSDMGLGTDVTLTNAVVLNK